MHKLPPIFVISLQNSPRRSLISARFATLKIPFEFIDAVCGQDLDKAQLEQVDYEFYQKRFLGRKPLTRGEIGCAMSHLKCYQTILDRNLEQAIILEDDAIVSQDFEKIVLDALAKVPSRREIIFFDHGKAKYWPFTRKLKEGYKLVRYRAPSKNSVRTIMKATAYLLTFSGAQKLLKFAYPIRVPADYVTGAIQLTGIHAYGVEPSCVFISALGSEIDSIERRTDGEGI